MRYFFNRFIAIAGAALCIAVLAGDIGFAQSGIVKPPAGGPTASSPGRSTPTGPVTGTGRPDVAIPGVQKVMPVGPATATPATTVGGGNTQASTTTLSAAPDLVIGPGDLLEISVYGAPDFDRVPARVNGSGEILLPLIGNLKIAGMKPEDAAGLVRNKLLQGGYYADPQVTVFTREYATQGVSVLGEVQKPGVYPVLGQRKLFDAISLAGGLTPRAGRFVTISRKGEEPKNYTLGSDTDHSMESNVDISPGDTVVVSKAGIVYVVGDVRMPGGFVMDSGAMSVLQAVAMAQGANGTAKLDSAKLIRRAGGTQQELPLPLKQMLASKAPDMTLQPDDIVFIPNSASKSAARRSFEAVIQAATGVAIYRSRVP